MTDTQTLPPHIQRVVDEKIDLDVRLNNLIRFIENNPIYQSLPKQEKELQQMQRLVMTMLSNILRQQNELHMGDKKDMKNV